MKELLKRILLNDPTLVELDLYQICREIKIKIAKIFRDKEIELQNNLKKSQSEEDKAKIQNDLNKLPDELEAESEKNIVAALRPFIIALYHNTTITKVSLNFNLPADLFSTIITLVRKNNTIEKLDLSNNLELDTATAIKLFSELKKNKSINLLNISATGIKSECLSTLMSLLHTNNKNISITVDSTILSGFSDTNKSGPIELKSSNQRNDTSSNLNPNKKESEENKKQKNSNEKPSKRMSIYSQEHRNSFFDENFSKLMKSDALIPFMRLNHKDISNLLGLEATRDSLINGSTKPNKHSFFDGTPLSEDFILDCVINSIELDALKLDGERGISIKTSKDAPIIKLKSISQIIDLKINNLLKFFIIGLIVQNTSETPANAGATAILWHILSYRCSPSLFFSKSKNYTYINIIDDNNLAISEYVESYEACILDERNTNTRLYSSTENPGCVICEKFSVKVSNKNEVLLDDFIVEASYDPTHSKELAKHLFDAANTEEYFSRQTEIELMDGLNKLVTFEANQKFQTKALIIQILSRSVPKKITPKNLKTRFTTFFGFSAQNISETIEEISQEFGRFTANYLSTYLKTKTISDCTAQKLIETFKNDSETVIDVRLPECLKSYFREQAAKLATERLAFLLKNSTIETAPPKLQYLNELKLSAKIYSDLFKQDFFNNIDEKQLITTIKNFNEFERIETKCPVTFAVLRIILGLSIISLANKYINKFKLQRENHQINKEFARTIYKQIPEEYRNLFIETVMSIDYTALFPLSSFPNTDGERLAANALQNIWINGLYDRSESKQGISVKILSNTKIYAGNLKLENCSSVIEEINTSKSKKDSLIKFKNDDTEYLLILNPTDFLPNVSLILLLQYMTGYFNPIAFAKVSIDTEIIPALIVAPFGTSYIDNNDPISPNQKNYYQLAIFSIITKLRISPANLYVNPVNSTESELKIFKFDGFSNSDYIYNFLLFLNQFLLDITEPEFIEDVKMLDPKLTLKKYLTDLENILQSFKEFYSSELLEKIQLTPKGIPQGLIANFYSGLFNFQQFILNTSTHTPIAFLEFMAGTATANKYLSKPTTTEFLAQLESVMKNTDSNESTILTFSQAKTELAKASSDHTVISEIQKAIMADDDDLQENLIANAFSKAGTWRNYSDEPSNRDKVTSHSLNDFVKHARSTERNFWFTIDQSLLENFIRKLDFSSLRENTQQLILRELSRIPLQNLELNNCTALNGELLSQILKNSKETLKALSIENDSFSDLLLSQFCKNSPQLYELKISNQFALIQPNISSESLSYLEISSCSPTARITIDCPNLKQLIINDCALLKFIDLKTPNLQYLNLENCQTLNIQNIEKQLTNCKNLQKKLLPKATTAPQIRPHRIFLNKTMTLKTIDSVVPQQSQTQPTLAFRIPNGYSS